MKLDTFNDIDRTNVFMMSRFTGICNVYFESCYVSVTDNFFLLLTIR